MSGEVPILYIPSYLNESGQQCVQSSCMTVYLPETKVHVIHGTIISENTVQQSGTKRQRKDGLSSQGSSQSSLHCHRFTFPGTTVSSTQVACLSAKPQTK